MLSILSVMCSLFLIILYSLDLVFEEIDLSTTEFKLLHVICLCIIVLEICVNFVVKRY